jgi:hypothetical protein
VAVEHAARRYALGKRWWAEQTGDTGLADMWRDKQIAEATDPLPAGFPFRAALIATGYYLGLADLAGATADELAEFCFGYTEAEAIIAALPEGYTALEIYT